MLFLLAKDLNFTDSISQLLPSIGHYFVSVNDGVCHAEVEHVGRRGSQGVGFNLVLLLLEVPRHLNFLA